MARGNTMGRFNLDELECDELYHALLGRKSDLEATIKRLEEKEGLPEAAAAVRDRLAIYNPNGDGKAARVGLIRMFAPQHDLEAAARNDREERDSDGQQDAFGGGAETGGRPKRTRKNKEKPEVDGTETAADAPAGPRILSDEQRDALARLEGIAETLLAGPAQIEPGEFAAERDRALELVKVVQPVWLGDTNPHTVAIEALGQQEANAEALGTYLKEFATLERAVVDAPAPTESAEQSEPADTGAMADGKDRVLSFAEPDTNGAGDGTVQTETTATTETTETLEAPTKLTRRGRRKAAAAAANATEPVTGADGEGAAADNGDTGDAWLNEPLREVAGGIGDANAPAHNDSEATNESNLNPAEG